MAYGNPSGTSVWTNYIDSEMIDRQLSLAVADPFVGEFIVRVINMAADTSRTFTHPLLERIAASTAHADADQYSFTAMSTSQEQIACAVYSSEIMVPFSVTGVPGRNGPSTVVNPLLGAVTNVVDANRQVMENAILGVTLSNTAGDNATTNDFQNWATVKQVFRSQAKNPQGVAAVLHDDAIRDLELDLGSNAAALFSTDYGARSQEMFGPVAKGYRGMLDGIMIFESGAIPVADTSGWGNVMTEIGSEAGIGLAVKAPPTPIVKDANDGHGFFVTSVCDFGADVLDQDRCLQFITRT